MSDPMIVTCIEYLTCQRVVFYSTLAYSNRSDLLSQSLVLVTYLQQILIAF